LTALKSFKPPTTTPHQKKEIYHDKKNNTDLILKQDNIKEQIFGLSVFG